MKIEDVDYFYLAMLAWSAFLLWQLFRIPRAGLAFRYAIPVAIILFSVAEVGAFFGMYPEYWKDVVAYPISNATTLALFVGGSWLLLRRDDEAPSTAVTES